MRVSNLQFSKGSVVYADFDKNGELAYLNGRPLIVVSNPIHIFNRIVVCTTGTRGKPGIKISLFNYYSNKYIADTEISTIYPNSLYSVETSSIKQCIGVLDPYIMKAVDKSVAFFLGLSDEVPEYLRDYMYVYDVEYTRAKPEYVRPNEACGEHYLRNYNTFLNANPSLAAPPPIGISDAAVPDSNPVDTGNPATKKKMETVKSIQTKSKTAVKFQKPKTKPKNELQAFLDECCILGPELKSTAADLLMAYNHFAENTGYKTTVASGFGKKLNHFIGQNGLSIEHIRDPFSNYYSGIGLTPTVKKDALNLVIRGGTEDNSKAKPQIYFRPEDSDEIRTWAKSTNPEEVMEGITDPELLSETIALATPQAAAIIASRKASINAVAIKYDLDLLAAEALRTRLTNLSMEFGRKSLTDLEKNPSSVNLDKLDDFTQVGIALLVATNSAGIRSKSRVRINKLVRDTEANFGMELSDTSKWKDLGATL